jgi:G:T/U-mismatch repair DNA glycosylase
MFHHRHPYPPFFPKEVSKLIVGTLPPPRFSTGLLKEDDVNFCYGSRDGLLWPVLERIFNLNLQYNNSDAAILQRKVFLETIQVGICDIVASCIRKKIDASDLGMTDIVLRDLLGYLKTYWSVDTLLFTGGNSKNGPEYLFRRHLKTNGIRLQQVSSEIPKIHEFVMPDSNRIIKTVSLTAPSGSANRAIGSMLTFKLRKAKNPEYSTLDFRAEQYAPYFK